MNIREKSTGCRLITVNTNNTCPNIRNMKGNEKKTKVNITDMI